MGPANRPAFCRQVPHFYAKCPSKNMLQVGRSASQVSQDWLMRICKLFPMPYNLQVSLCISIVQMKGVYLSFLWISPEVVGSVVFSQVCESITNMLLHLLKGLLLCADAHIIGVQENPCVGMNMLAICIMLNNRGVTKSH